MFGVRILNGGGVRVAEHNQVVEHNLQLHVPLDPRKVLAFGAACRRQTGEGGKAADVRRAQTKCCLV